MSKYELRKKSIFRELEGQIKKSGYSYSDLKKLTGMSVNSLLEKRKGTRDWTRKEMLLVKSLLHYSGTIEELFLEDDVYVSYNLNIDDRNENNLTEV